jgi:hypothetical protein
VCPLILLWGTTVFASPLKSKPVYDFSKGCDTYHSSLSLPDGFVADSQDVLFDDKAPITKRHGYSTAFSSGSWSYEAEWAYTDPTNTSWIIVRSSSEIIANNLAGTTVVIATVSANNLVGETNSQGWAFFVDQTQGVYYWNGSTTTYVANSPLGSLIASFHNRIWVAGAAVPNGNQLYGSSYGDGTTWPTGLNPNNPVQLTVGLQDNFDNITAMYVFLDTMYTFKHFSTYALTGYDQTSFAIGFITQECGCIDQQSIQTFNHGLDFVSERGVEFFDGYTCTRISDSVKDKVNNAIQSQGGNNTLSWVQSTQSDFNAGTASSTTYSSTLFGITLTTSVVQNSSILNPSFEAQPGGNNPPTNWTQSSYVCNGSICSGFFGETGGNYCSCSYSASNGVFDESYLQSFSAGASVSVALVSYPSESVIVSTTLPVSNCSWSTATLSSSGQIGNVVQIQITVSGSYDSNMPFILTSSTFEITNDVSFNYLSHGQDGNCSVPAWAIDNFTGGANGINFGTFTSQSHALGSITNFGNFSVQDNLNGGNIAFSICSSANSNMTSASCSVQTPNSQITISTNAYVDWTATFTVTSATQTPTLNSATVQWFSGIRNSGMASTVWDDRYWLALSTNTSDSFNDTILVLNIPGAWSPFNIQAGGLTQYKNSLYIADAKPTGNVYLYGNGYNDNGNAINAYIRSKDYAEDQLSTDDYYDSMYVSEDDGGNYNTQIGYYMDHDLNTEYLLSSLNQTELSANAAIKIPFLGTNQDFGKCISLKFSESDLGSPWNFYGWEMFYHPREVQ